MSGASLVLAIAGAAIAILGVTEALARFVLRRSGYYVWQRFYRRTLHLDRETFPQLEPVVYFEANADGERSGPSPDRPDLFRMLLLGGSTVESAMNDQPTTWAGRLHTLLNEPAAKAHLGAGYVHVGNVGRSGLDVRGVARILELTLRRYRQLDLIGVMVGPGDLMRWLEEGAPADRVPSTLAAPTCFAEHPHVELSFNPRRFALTEFVRRARMRWLQPLDVRENAARWMGRARRMRREAKEVRREMPENSRFLDHFEAGLVDAIGRAAASRARVVLIRQPSFRKPVFDAAEEALFWNGGIGNVYRGDVPSVYFATEVMYGLLDLMDERIRRVGERFGVPFLDPQCDVTMSAASFFDHFHLTPRGADELGRSIARRILEAVPPRA